MMCLILFAYDCHPQYKLIVAANRDEYYARPTLAAAFWDDHPELLAGRDLREGGTWMGITTGGRFAALTNYRDPASFKSNAPSRGHLVHNFLKSDLAPASYIAGLDHGGVAYNGFNLLLGTSESLYYYSNREQQIRNVTKGIHGMSNSLLDVPWPKVTRGSEALAGVLQHEEIDVERLFTLMADREPVEDRNLPETGVGVELERIFAPAFVVSPNYGTRLTTVLLVDRNHHVRFWERSYPNHRPDTWDEVRYEFQGCQSDDR